MLTGRLLLSFLVWERGAAFDKIECSGGSPSHYYRLEVRMRSNELSTGQSFIELSGGWAAMLSVDSVTVYGLNENGDLDSAVLLPSASAVTALGQAGGLRLSIPNALTVANFAQRDTVSLQMCMLDSCSLVEIGESTAEAFSTVRLSGEDSYWALGNIQWFGPPSAGQVGVPRFSLGLPTDASISH